MIDEAVGFLLLLELFQLLVSIKRWFTEVVLFCTNIIESFFKPMDPRKYNDGMDKYRRGYKG